MDRAAGRVDSNPSSRAGGKAVPPRNRRLPRALREQQMVDAAVAVFSARGYHAASMDEIAERARISKPMLYTYLGAKEELFAVCVRREGRRLREAVAGAVDLDQSPEDQLWRGLRAFFDFVGSNRDGWRVLYRQAQVLQPFAADLAEVRGGMVDVISGLLAQAMAAEGQRKPATELRALAYALVGAGESLADWVIDHPDEDSEMSAARLMNLVWMGAGSLLRGQLWRRP